jgi:hypothetical protein
VVAIHVGRGHRRLARCPRHGFDENAAGAAIHAARRIQQKDEPAPKRNEVEPSFGLVVVRRPWLAAAAAPALAVLSGGDPRFDVGRSALARHEPDIGVHEVLEPVHVIEYGLELELHRVFPAGEVLLGRSCFTLPDVPMSFPPFIPELRHCLAIEAVQIPLYPQSRHRCGPRLAVNRPQICLKSQ